jgi:hypothetical protein
MRSVNLFGRSSFLRLKILVVKLRMSRMFVNWLDGKVCERESDSY